MPSFTFAQAKTLLAPYVSSIGALFTGSISGTALTVTALTSGTIKVGLIISGTGVTSGTYIVSGSGNSWVVSSSQSVSSTSIIATDPEVEKAINFVNEKFITGGEWKGNRFIHSFGVNTDSNGNFYFDTVPGVESVLKVIALDTENKQGEISDIMSDWYPWVEGGMGWMPPNYAGDTRVIRQGPSSPNPLPSDSNPDTQRYRVVGRVPETRTMYCIVRRGYVVLQNDTDLLIPSNRNAYRYGLQAYNYENRDDLERAMVYWQLAFDSLNNATLGFQDGETAEIDIQTKGFAAGGTSGIQNLI
jgi:hypothetical protein